MAVSINSMSINGEPPKDKSSQGFNKRWWLSSDKLIYQDLGSVFSQLYKYDSQRATQYIISTKLYANTTLMGTQGISLAKIATSTQNTPKERLSYNLVQSVIDTLVSKTSKNKPKPMFLTSGGDYDLQTKAKNLEKFVDGICYANKCDGLDDQLDRDSFVFGDGIQHVYVQDNEIKIERVLPSELIVDQYEAYYGFPRQMHRFKRIDRMVLADMFPSKKTIIMECNSASEEIASTVPNMSDEITVLESWHLPSGKDSEDGKHCICINNGTLLAEEYTKDYFPFIRLSWCKRLAGYWSQGLAEQLQPIQLEINKILYVIQKSLQMGGSFKVLIENGSKIVNEHLTNDIGALIYYNGTKPEYITPPILQPEYFAHLASLKQSGYEQAGISMLSAASQKPSGLDSGRALREYNDIETERFLFFGHEKERFIIERTKIIVDMAKDIYENSKKGMKVKFPGKKFIETIDWKEVSLADDEFVLKIYPVSSLPQTPEGKLQTIIENMQAGLISPKAGKKLLDYPDLEQFEELENAEEEYLNKVMQGICSKGKDAYVAPDSFDDIQLAREICLQYIAKGKLHNLPNDRMSLLQTFISQLDLLIEKSMESIQQAQPATQAVPEAPPTSPMLPNGGQ